MGPAVLDTSWTLTLPTLDGVLPKSRRLFPNRLSLSRSISGLFNSATTLPPPSLLDRVSIVATTASPSSTDLRTALADLGTFAAGLRSAVTARDSPGTDRDVAAATGAMLGAFLHGAVACVRFLNAGSDEGEAGASAPAMNEKAAHAALRQCLEGTFILFPTLKAYGHNNGNGGDENNGEPSTSSSTSSIEPPAQVTAALTDVEHALLASLFPHTPLSLSALFERARALTHALCKVSSSRPKPGAHRGSTLSPSPVAGAPASPLSAARMHAALITLTACVGTLDRLPLPAAAPPPRNKKERAAADAAERSRPRRLALEAQLARCDLALAMATATIDAVKRRAADRDGLDDDGAGSEGGGCEAWDETAEGDLEACLVAALEMVQHRRVGVLVEPVLRREWIDEEEEEGGEAGMGDTNGHDGNGNANGLGHDGHEDEDGDDDEEDSDDDQDDLDDLDSMSVDSDPGQPGGAAHASPLRTLFRLHDRYEEQRIAVWMSMGPGAGGQRPKMGQFVRGADGRVGDRWDELGAALLLDLTPEEMMRHGLSPEKLERVVERSERGTEGRGKKAKRGRK